MNAEYTCRRTASKPPLSGALNDPAWHAAEKSPRFVDMVSGEPGFYDTRAAALWDDESLYVAFWAEEPFVRASLTERDSLVFLENDLELFIDGGDCYYEFEINALGTVYEVFFIWKDAFGKFDAREWDLTHRNVLSFAGNDDRDAATFWRGTHPRGARWAFLDWDLPGLRYAVHVNGCINDDSVADRGWTVELAIPWSGMAPLANNRSLPPREGDVWRMFFGRFEKLKSAGVEIQPHPAWVWTPHGVYDTHRPECFTTIRFSNEVAI
ncbi:MAG TPA: carbohydrate-binding family 9-like protein [Bryobacteraceae bacterium]